MIISALTHALAFIVGAVCCAVYVWPYVKRKPSSLYVTWQPTDAERLHVKTTHELQAAQKRQRIEVVRD